MLALQCETKSKLMKKVDISSLYENPNNSTAMIVQSAGSTFELAQYSVEKGLEHRMLAFGASCASKLA